MQRKQQAASGQGRESGSIFASRARPVYCSAPARKRYCGLTSALTMASYLAMVGSGALADEAAGQGRSAAQPTNEQLIEKLERMEARIQSLESELHRKGEAAESKKPKARTAASRGNPAKAPAGAKDTVPGFPGYNETAALESPPPSNNDLFGVAPSPLPGLKIAAYGELRFGAQQNPAANGQWQTGFDAARIVLLPSYQFNDNIIFNPTSAMDNPATRKSPAW